MFKRLMKAREGTTLVEYSLILGLSAVVVVGGYTTLGGNVGAVFAAIKTAISSI